jgi:osmotically-inducible protein OsmY
MNMNEQLATCDAHDSVRQLEPLVLRRLNGTLRSLKLTIRDAGVVLRGHARTYYAKQLAQHAVMQLTKVRIRANEIEVAQVPKDSASK